MTVDLIHLEGHRSTAEQRETEIRRRPANGQPPLLLSQKQRLESFEDQMLAESARTWAEVLKKWRVLPDRYATTLEARGKHIHKRIERALGDIEHLRKREERQ